MTKDFLLRLTEEHYGAGAFPVYGRLLEEQRLTRGGPLRLATDAWTGAERNAVERGRMAFEDVLTFQEDVYELLRQHTPPKQRRENGLPWAISKDVRKGKYAAQGMPKLIENYVFLSCGFLRSLSPRSR